MKRKMAALLVAASLIAGLLAGCGGGGSQTTGNNSEGQSEEQKETEEADAGKDSGEEAAQETAESQTAETGAADGAAQPAQPAELVLPSDIFENDFIKVTVSDIEVDEYITLMLQVENLTEQELVVFLESPYLNGMAASDTFKMGYGKPGPKETVEITWRFSNDNKKLVAPEPVLNSVEELKRLDTWCAVKDESGTYHEEAIVWEPTGESYDAAGQFVPGQNASLALEDETIRIYNGDLVVEADSIGSTVSSEIILVNKTDRWMDIAFSKKMSVNGKEWDNQGENSYGSEINPYQLLAPHSINYTKMKGSASALVVKDITSAEDIQEMTVKYVLLDVEKLNEEGAEAARLGDGTLKRTK